MSPNPIQKQSSNSKAEGKGVATRSSSKAQDASASNEQRVADLDDLDIDTAMGEALPNVGLTDDELVEYELSDEDEVMAPPEREPEQVPTTKQGKLE